MCNSLISSIRILLNDSLYLCPFKQTKVDHYRNKGLDNLRQLQLFYAYKYFVYSSIRKKPYLKSLLIIRYLLKVQKLSKASGTETKVQKLSIEPINFPIRADALHVMPWTRVKHKSHNLLFNDNVWAWM